MNLLRRIGGHGFTAMGEAAALLLLSPVAVSFSTRVPLWDELYFFHHAACIRNAAGMLSWRLADGCMASMAKSPILALMLLPSAPLRGPEGLAVAPIMLSVLCFALIWLGIRLAQRGGIPLPMAIAAAGAAVLATPLRAGAPFLSDELLAIVVLDTLLLLPLESADPGVTTGAAFRRGLLWGLLLGLGVLTKLTYFYFAGVTFSLLVLLSWWLCGTRLTAAKLAGMAVVSAPVAALFARYGTVYWSWAMNAAFGPISQLYNDNLQRWPFLQSAADSVGVAYWAAVAVLLGISAVLWVRRLNWRALFVCCGLIGIVLGYLFIASGSPNKDPRFFWPVWLALPFCLAALGASRAGTGPARMRSVGLLPLGLGVLLSIAACGRFNFREVARMDLILHAIPHDHPVKVLIASDEGAFNVETLILARQLDLAQLGQMAVGTVVYDFVAHRTVEDSIRRLTSADYVILRDPVDHSAPDWANQHLPEFAKAVESDGHLLRSFPGSEETRIYAMH